MPRDEKGNIVSQCPATYVNDHGAHVHCVLPKTRQEHRHEDSRGEWHGEQPVRPTNGEEISDE